MALEQERITDNARRRRNMRVALIAIIIGWTYAYNLLIKGQGPFKAFLEILDTISDDFILGTLITIGVGLGIVVVFSITKLYTQVVSNIYSFRIIESLFLQLGRTKNWREFVSNFLRLEDQPPPKQVCPERTSSLIFSLAFIYLVSWIYLILFSEALFFVSWSAGVNLPLGETENMLFLPTLALAIPFSARVMAYLRYPYAQDYADFMPGAVFALLVVAFLGTIFESRDQKFFLLQIWENSEYLKTFLVNGTVLAFIPVFFEGGFWIYELGKEEQAEKQAEKKAKPQNAEAIEGPLATGEETLPVEN